MSSASAGEIVVQLMNKVDPDLPFFTFAGKVPEASSTYTTVSIMLALSLLMLFLRLWTRTQLVKVFGWDDAFMVLTVACYTVFCSIIILIATIVSNGTGSLTLRQLKQITRLLIVSECFYIWTMVFLKVSLAVFFLRIMIKTVQRRVVQFTVALSTAMGIVYFFVAVFQCGTPVTAENELTKLFLNQCLTKTAILAFSYLHASITLLTDLILALIPLLMLRGSQLSVKEKWIVYFILSLGTVGAIASALRIQYLKTLTELNPSFFANSRDLGVWSAIEPGMGIIAACLATLRKLFGFAGRQLSSLKSKITPTHSLASSNRADPLTAPDDEYSYPESGEDSDVHRVHQTDFKSIEKTQRWRQDVELAALPASMQSSNMRVNEAYG